MSKAEILSELPTLSVEDRREILDRIYEMDKIEDDDDGPTEEEKAILDAEIKDMEKNPDEGTPWEEVYEELKRENAARKARR